MWIPERCEARVTHRRNGHDAKVRRQTGAAERQAAENPPKVQIARLDSRLGRGEGATKERARLAAAS